MFQKGQKGQKGHIDQIGQMNQIHELYQNVEVLLISAEIQLHDGLLQFWNFYLVSTQEKVIIVLKLQALVV